MTINQMRDAIKQRKRELDNFDNSTKEEQKKLTELGLNPYESNELRAKRKKAHFEKRKREFNALPEKERRILTKLGFNPHENEVIETAERKDIKI